VLNRDVGAGAGAGAGEGYSTYGKEPTVENCDETRGLMVETDETGEARRKRPIQ
jgi:hypothetical protein